MEEACKISTCGAFKGSGSTSKKAAIFFGGMNEKLRIFFISQHKWECWDQPCLTMRSSQNCTPSNVKHLGRSERDDHRIRQNNRSKNSYDFDGWENKPFYSNTSKISKTIYKVCLRWRTKPDRIIYFSMLASWNSLWHVFKAYMLLTPSETNLDDISTLSNSSVSEEADINPTQTPFQNRS